MPAKSTVAIVAAGIVVGVIAGSVLRKQITKKNTEIKEQPIEAALEIAELKVEECEHTSMALVDVEAIDELISEIAAIPEEATVEAAPEITEPEVETPVEVEAIDELISEIAAIPEEVVQAPAAPVVETVEEDEPEVVKPAEPVFQAASPRKVTARFNRSMSKETSHDPYLNAQIDYSRSETPTYHWSSTARQGAAPLNGTVAPMPSLERGPSMDPTAQPWSPNMDQYDYSQYHATLDTYAEVADSMDIYAQPWSPKRRGLNVSAMPFSPPRC